MRLIILNEDVIKKKSDTKGSICFTWLRFSDDGAATEQNLVNLDSPSFNIDGSLEVTILMRVFYTYSIATLVPGSVDTKRTELKTQLEVKGQETDQASKPQFVDLVKGAQLRGMNEDGLFIV